MEGLVQQWSNNPAPYDLAETERVNGALQPPIIWSSRRFDIADYVKLDDPKLIALIRNVDEAGPGAATTTSVASKKQQWPGSLVNGALTAFFRIIA